MTSNGCTQCGGTGLLEVSRQGDPIPNLPGWTYSATMYVSCSCCLVLVPTTFFPALAPAEPERLP